MVLTRVLDAVDLKNRLCDIETDCRDRVHDGSYKSWGCVYRMYGPPLICKWIFAS